jgi:hypothetical protein
MIAYSNVASRKKRKYNLAIQGGIYGLLAAARKACMEGGQRWPAGDDRCGRQVESLEPSSWRVTGWRRSIEPKTPRDARVGGRHGSI